jgi:hypothetical protein
MVITHELAWVAQRFLAEEFRERDLYLGEDHLEVVGVESLAGVAGVVLKLSDGSQVHLTIQAVAAPAAAKKDTFEAYKERVLADLPPKKFIELNT